MSKDTADLHDLPLTQETPAMQSTLDTFNAFLNAPVTKLDADEYMANDIDGVTESLLGSGNLNFLMMQASQTDEAISNADPFKIDNVEIALPTSGVPGGTPLTSLAGTGRGGDVSMDRVFDMPSGHDRLSDFGTSGQNNTAGTLGASSAAANNQYTNPLSGTASFSSSSANTGSNGSNGNNGNSGNNGNNGVDGEGAGNTTINNTTNNVTNNITNNDNTVIDNTINLGDTNIEIINENILETVENIFNTTNDFLTTVVNNTTDIINNIFNGNPLDLGPIGISLDAVLDDLLDLDLDLINGDNILSVINETIDLSPVTNLVEGLTGDIIADIGLDVILDPFQYDNSPNDYDVHIGLDLLNLGLPDIDIPLDPVEFLLGDIDIGLDLAEDLLGSLPLLGEGTPDTDLGLVGLETIADLTPVTNLVENLVNPVEDLAGDLDILAGLHVDLLGLGADGTGPDTDIVIPLDLDLIDSDLLGSNLEVSLDPVEAFLGDIDLDLTIAGDILGNVADGLIDNEAGGSATDNILSGLGDTLAGVAGDILDTDGEAGDTDILLDTGLDIAGAELVDNATEILLDPVENIIGDIDITGDTSIDLLNPGDFASAGDTDLSLGIDIIGAGLPPIDVNLDLLESITGDIDLDLDVSADIIEMVTNPETILDGVFDTVENTIDTALGLICNLPENTGGLDLGALLPSGGENDALLPSWTESLLPDAGNILGDGLLGGFTDILPDPVAAAPVIALPTIPVVIPVPHIGGGHFGGLFG